MNKLEYLAEYDEEQKCDAIIYGDEEMPGYYAEVDRKKTLPRNLSDRL
jgi:hypothetical protein